MCVYVCVSFFDLPRFKRMQEWVTMIPDFLVILRLKSWLPGDFIQHLKFVAIPFFGRKDPSRNKRHKESTKVESKDPSWETDGN